MMGLFLWGLVEDSVRTMECGLDQHQLVENHVRKYIERGGRERKRKRGKKRGKGKIEGREGENILSSLRNSNWPKGLMKSAIVRV